MRGAFLALLILGAAPQAWAAKPAPAQESLTATRAPRALGSPAVVIPRQNCGTHWTGWVNVPGADVNPCPKGCERGRRLQLDEHKTGDATQYQANYECYLPRLEVRQRALKPRAAGAPPRQNCGTHWTGWQSRPDSEANPCPANCERGELRLVNRNRSGDKLVYDLNYRCYLKEAETTQASQSNSQNAPTSSTPGAPSSTQQSAPPQTSAPKATARVDLRSVASANFGNGGSISASGERVGIGLYTTLDASSRYYLHLNPDAGGHYRVRATVSNIQGATTLTLESAEGTANCPLARMPGYNNFQTCDLVFDLPSPHEVTVTARKAADAVAQVTLAKLEVARESATGAALAAGQLVLAGPQQAAFDNLAAAKVNATASPVKNGAHVELSDSSVLAINLLGAPAGSYRFRAMIGNTSAAGHFSIAGGGQQAGCDIPATPGYQNAVPCDLVVSVTTAGSNLGVVLRKQAGGAPAATVDTVFVYQE